MKEIQMVAEKIFFPLVCLIAFIIPLNNILVTPLLVMLVLAWLFKNNFKERVGSTLKNRLFYVAASFYLVHLIGMAYTDNWSYGLNDLKIKLPLLVFPMVLMAEKFEPKKINAILIFFIAGCFLSSGLYLGNATYDYFVLGLNNFYYSDLAFNIHPSYFAMYLNFALCSLFFLLINESDTSLNNKRKTTYSLFIAYFSVIIILLFSKAGIITLSLAGCIMAVFLLKRYGILYAGAYSVVLLAISALAFLLVTRNHYNRFEETMNSLNVELDSGATEGTAVRIAVWTSSFELMKKEIVTGVGTGDVKDALVTQYEKWGITAAVNERLNPHNQFIQTAIALGLPGLLSLLMTMAVLFRKAVKCRDYPALFFVIIIAINLLPESMLERQAGVMFFAFFYSVFSVHLFSKNQSLGKA